MIKLIAAIRRKPGMTPEQFRDTWKNQHGDLVRRSDLCGRYLRRYVQCHALAEEYAKGEPPFDGAAEMWFESVADKEAFYTDPEYSAVIRPDLERFADLSRTRYFMTREEPILGGLVPARSEAVRGR